jgi:hypothetical protein
LENYVGYNGMNIPARIAKVKQNSFTGIIQSEECGVLGTSGGGKRERTPWNRGHLDDIIIPQYFDKRVGKITENEGETLV